MKTNKINLGEPKYLVMAYENDENVRDGCTVDSTYDTLKQASHRAKYYLTEDYQRASESSIRLAYATVTNRFTGEIVADFYAKP